MGFFLKKEGLFVLLLVLNLFLLMFQMKRMLMALLAFEFLILKVFFMFIYMSSPTEGCPKLVLLAIAAGEASMGLSILMSLIRSGGRENLRSFSLMKCEGLLGY